MNMGQICGRRGRGLAAVRKRRLPSSWVIWAASQPRVLTRYLREAAHSGGRSGTLVGDLVEQARGEHRQHILHLLRADKGGRRQYVRGARCAGMEDGGEMGERV